MQESTRGDYNPDRGGQFWITVGVWFVLVWWAIYSWLGIWGAALGWIVAAPAAIALTICFWIGVDVVRHLTRKLTG